MIHIISEEDAERFLSAKPVVEDIDQLTRDELIVLASYMSLEGMADKVKHIIQNKIKQELFGIVSQMGDDVSCEEGELDSQPLERAVLPQSSASFPEFTPSLNQFHLADPNLEGNFTAEQRFEIYKMREQARLDQTRLDHEYRMAKLNQPAEDPASSSSMTLNFSNLIPAFLENEVEDFFILFEEVAVGMKWPVIQWPFLLQSSLTGKARTTYISVTEDVRQDYYRLKKAILDVYQLRPEAYRQKFRKTTKRSDQSHVNFLHQTKKVFHSWMKSQTVGNVEEMTEVIVLENFLDNIEPWVANYLRNKSVNKCDEAAALADDFVLNKKLIKSNSSQGKPRVSYVKQDFSTDQLSQNTHTSSRDKSAAQLSGNNCNLSSMSPKNKIGSNNSTAEIKCYYCRAKGHVKSKCWKKMRDENRVGSVAAVTETSKTENTRIGNRCGENDVVACVFERSEEASVAEVSHDKWSPPPPFNPFIYSGKVCLLGHEYEVKVLRDTGSDRTLFLNPNPGSHVSDTCVVLTGLGGPFSAQLAEARLECDLFKGKAVVGVADELPIKGVDVILGNDLCGMRVRPDDPIVSVAPIVEPLTNVLESEFPHVFPLCAMTRSMAKVNLRVKPTDEAPTNGNVVNVSREIMNDGDMNDLSNTFFANLDDVNELPDKGTSGLIELQLHDDDCKYLTSSAVNVDNLDQEPATCFYMKDGILWRRWRPAYSPADEGVWDVHQIVVPKESREKILEIGHCTPLSGHLGVRKTLERVRSHFFWPGMHADVRKFCNACHTCQIIGKPNKPISKVPLVPLPIFEQPFTRVLIDIVGPLPKSSQGHIYLLTIMDMATRYPEAIPLRSLSSRIIVKELFKFFTHMGFPREIQSDQGSVFVSKLFKQTLKELGIEQILSSAYHPQSQGALERYHQTFKTMLKKYCEDTGKDWDQGVPFLLFATREVPNESLGFSPNELMFGHRVRGPLQFLKEKWACEGQVNLLKYVLEFKERLYRSCQFANDNLKAAQQSMKGWYDRKARQRKFEPRDEVLVLLPLTGQPLAAQYKGPYKVVRQVGDTDYLIATPDRRKAHQLCHINMLKPYVRKEALSTVGTVAVIHGSDVVISENMCREMVGSECSNEKECDLDRNDIFYPPSMAGVRTFGNNSSAWRDLPQKLLHLESEQAAQLINVLSQSSSVFQDVPGRTTETVHDVDVGDASPVKLSPYRVSPSRRGILQAELDYMTSNKLVERAVSAWSSPVTLAPKPGGQYRFCIDYRRVNSLTKTDTYPLPRVDDCIDQIGTATYISRIDLMKGYWQVPLTHRAREISCFVANNQSYVCNVMPFGMKNAPATFQRLMNNIILGIPGCVVYIDDILLFSHSWEDHVIQLSMLFSRLSEANLVINLGKSEFVKSHALYLGYVVGQGQIVPPRAKVQVILDFPNPKNRRDIQRFLGMVGYYRKFIHDFSKLAAPLTDLLSKRISKFNWTENCEKAFCALKNILATYPVLRSPNFNKTFSIAVDASNVGAGGALLQEDEVGVLHPVCYFSKKFNQAQKNYSVIEKELLSLIWSLQYFGVYVQSAPDPIVIFTDHHPLRFLNKFRDKNQRLTRWSLWLQEYNLDIKHIKGTDNVLADCLSRM